MSGTTLAILNKRCSECSLKVFNVETSDVLCHSNKDKQNSIMGSHHIMHEQFLRK